MEAILEIVSHYPIERAVAVFFLVLARIGPFVFLVPAFGGQNLPAAVRTMVAVVLSAVTWPLAWQSTPTLPGGTALLVLLVAKEILVGLALGMVVALLFHAFDAAGRIVDSLRGSQMASISSSFTQDPSSPLGSFLLLFAVAVFASLNGHVLLVRALAESYRILPAGTWLPGAGHDLIRLVLEVAAQYFVLAVAISAPLLATAFLVDLTVGLVGRAVPQMPSYFLALPLKAWTALLVLLLAMPLVTRLLWKLADSTATLVLETARLAAGA